MEVSSAVLVVEDEPNLRDLLAEVLRDEGFTVRTAANGSDALSTLEEWRPRVIILDLHMPRMDGWAFRQAQRSLPALAEIPIIVLSATSQLPAKAAALDAAAVIPKPYNLDSLIRTVKDVATLGQ